MTTPFAWWQLLHLKRSQVDETVIELSNGGWNRVYSILVP